MSSGGDFRRTLRLFGRFTVGQRRFFLFAVALLALDAATAVAVPDLIKKLTDHLVGHRRQSLFWWTPPAGATVAVLALAIVLATAVNSASESLADISLAKGARTLGFNLRGALFAHLQRLPLAFHLRRGTGDVLTRLTGDITAMEDFVQDSVADIVGSLLILAATMSYLLGQSWQIALLAVAIVPLLSVVSNVFARRIKSASKQLRASEGELASTAQEMLSSISLVQVYGRGEFQERRFEGPSRSARDAFLRTARLDAVFSFLVAVLESLGIAGVILVGSRLVASHSLTAGELIAFILLIQNMFKPIRRIIKQWNKVASVYASVDRVGELLDRRATVVDAPDARPAPPLRGEIEFRDVSFAYASTSDDDPTGTGARLALYSLSFRMLAGESVALVGHSGAGKSTIAQLLPRLYDPHAGAVLVDGHDIRSYTLGSLRAQISMVLQETVLLRGTVAENIAYGREGATDDDVVRAAQLANAHDFVMAMPEGYETVLGERAATLSGGQRQRLAIARAFIRDAPVLILDEPTTGLDAESAAQVAEALQTLARDRSTVIVSHDLNLIRTVDRILVISAGRILEEGSPADLLASGGLYADLYARQFGEAVAAADGMLPSAPPAERAPAQRPADEVPVDVFDDLLDRAVPQPATPEEFRALTGWIPTRQLADPGDDLDPLRSPVLSRELPGLAEALTREAMGPRLQRMLADGWELLACSPGKPFVELGEGATVQYRLELRGPDAGGTVEHLVAGRLFGTVTDAERWLSDISPLTASTGVGKALRAFARPAVLVPDLRLVLHAFPLDPTLPGLVVATDPAVFVSLLGPVLTTSVPGLHLDDCRAELVRYGDASCVLRYELAWRLEHTRRSLKQVLYGKVDGDERGQSVGPAVTALRQAPDGPGSALPFLVPRFQAYLPDLRLVLLEAIPGSPQLPALLRGPADGAVRLPGPVAGPLAGPPAQEALATCARIAAALHRSVVPVGTTRTLAEEIGGLVTAVDALASRAPALGAALHRRLRAFGDVTLESPTPLGLAHGDFQPSQVLFDGPTAGLVDFDTLCLAEAALDIGSFSAQLAVTLAGPRTAPQTSGNGAGDAESTFLRAYLRAADGSIEPDVLLARVAAYRTVALVRLAVRRWRRLDPQRLRPVLALLEEPQRVGVA